MAVGGGYDDVTKGVSFEEQGFRRSAVMISADCASHA